MNGTFVFNKLSTFASTSSSTLKILMDPLRRILTFSLADDSIYPAKSICASIDKGVLSVAYGSRFLSGIRIKGAREYPLEEGKFAQPDVFASSLSLAINDLGAPKSGITLSIPKAWAVIKTVDFPVAVKENLSQVVAYELDRITPFSAEDAYFDFKILGELEGKLSLALIAAKADFVRPYIDALGANGLTVNRVTINMSGIETLCRYADKKTGYIFLDMKKEGYEGALFMNGFITGAFTGNFAETDEKSKADAISKEIAPLIDMLKVHEKPVHIIALQGDKNPTLRELLQSRLSYTIRVLNETDMKIKVPGRSSDIPYAAVGGLLESLWTKANSLNLLDRGVHEQHKPPLFLTILLLLAIMAMWIFYIISPLNVEEKRLQEIDRQIMLRKDEIGKIETLKKEIDALQNEISTITHFKYGKPMALDILKELTAILPQNTWLSRVRITETTVEIEGYTTSVTGILSRLEASKYFRKAEFASPTFKDARMKSDRFNIKMEIEGVQKEEAGTKGTSEDDETE
jgi:Tfp pilus assembly protein PilN